MQHQFRVEAWNPGNGAIVADCADYFHASAVYRALCKVYLKCVIIKLDNGQVIDRYDNT